MWDLILFARTFLSSSLIILFAKEESCSFPTAFLHATRFVKAFFFFQKEHRVTAIFLNFQRVHVYEDRFGP